MGCSNSKELDVMRRTSMSIEASCTKGSGDGVPLQPIVTAFAAAAGMLPAKAGVYEPAPVPDNEAERLKTLRSLQTLDTPSDPRFDEITKLMCKLFKVSMSIVSIIDEYRCWLKAREGLSVAEAPRSVGICAWTLIPPHPELLVIEDTLEDARFRYCPLVVDPPQIRYYCGAPLVASNGHRLGNLVIMDTKPGKLDAERAMLLANFAEIVVRQIEKTTIANTHSNLVYKNTKSLLRALDCFSEGLMLCNLGTVGWDVVYVNDSWSKITGIATEAIVNTGLWSCSQLVGQSPTLLASIRKAVEQRSEFAVIISVQGKRFAVTFRPAQQGPMREDTPALGIPASVPWDPVHSGSQPFYFGTLRPATAADDAMRQVPPIVKSTTQQSGGVDPFQDVVLGPLLGRGSYGKVCRGIWRGTPVAVKIIQYTMGETKAAAACKSLEDLAGTKVVHPNICPCYRIMSRDVSASNDVIASQVSIEEDSMWRAVSAKARPACISGVSLGASDLDSAAGRMGYPQTGMHNHASGQDAILCSRSLSGALSVVDSVAEGASRNRTGYNIKDGFCGNAIVSEDSTLQQDTEIMPHRTPVAVGETPHATQYPPLNSASQGHSVTDSPSRSASPDGQQTADVEGNGDFCSVSSSLSQRSAASDTEGAKEEERAARHGAAHRDNSKEIIRAGSVPSTEADSGAGRRQWSGKQIVQETWMLMELCDMGTLLDACQRGRFIRIADDNSGMVPDMLAICQTLREVCSAMAYLHNLNVLHADLNGNNVLLVSCKRDARGFTAKVSDFGLSRIGSDVVKTATTGTTTHMPPEMLADGELSKATDVYGLGAIMWEMYHGKRAYAGMHPMQVMFQVAVKKLSLDFPADKDQDYVEIAKRCLLPDRHERPSMQELLDVMERLVQVYSA